jgi:hypothetical protein
VSGEASGSWGSPPPIGRATAAVRSVAVGYCPPKPRLLMIPSHGVLGQHSLDPGQRIKLMRDYVANDDQSYFCRFCQLFPRSLPASF